MVMMVVMKTARRPGTLTQTQAHTHHGCNLEGFPLSVLVFQKTNNFLLWFIRKPQKPTETKKTNLGSTMACLGHASGPSPPSLLRFVFYVLFGFVCFVCVCVRVCVYACVYVYVYVYVYAYAYAYAYA
jgi:hypothetical protein